MKEGNRILFSLATRATQKGWRRQHSRPYVSEWLSGVQEEAISSWVFCGTVDSCLLALPLGMLYPRHGRARRNAAQYQPGMETILTRCLGTRTWKPVGASRRKRLKKAVSVTQAGIIRLLLFWVNIKYPDCGFWSSKTVVYSGSHYSACLTDDFVTLITQQDERGTDAWRDVMWTVHT